MKKVLLSLVLLSLFVGGCKKEETTVPKSKTDLLCAHYWKAISINVNPPIDLDGTPVSDLLSIMDDCQKDDLVKYNNDKTVIYDEGATKCYPNSPQTTSGTWSFNSDETILTEDDEDLTLVELNETTLKLKIVQDIAGVDYTYSITYQKN
jgi:outer membrane lipoprotein-sorting protein